ncbi:hypothetical protein EC968_006168 [Mortierella alpina]|nr:hypothetical protein EC968_006168 [Mortierella alpina]
MSKAKHLQAILRGQHQLLHQLHANGPAAASASALGPLRLIPTRLLAGPGLDSDSRSIHTQSSDPNHIPGSGRADASSSNGSCNSGQQSASTSFFDQPFQQTRHNYVFAHGASGFAKHPGKAPALTPEEDRAYLSVQVGEDSYFRRHDALGVADGVGGWSGTTGK